MRESLCCNHSRRRSSRKLSLYYMVRGQTSKLGIIEAERIHKNQKNQEQKMKTSASNEHYILHKNTTIWLIVLTAWLFLVSIKVAFGQEIKTKETVCEPFKQGMTLGPGESTCISISIPLVASKMLMANWFLSELVNEGLAKWGDENWPDSIAIKHARKLLKFFDDVEIKWNENHPNDKNHKMTIPWSKDKYFLLIKEEWLKNQEMEFLRKKTKS